MNTSRPARGEHMDVGTGHLVSDVEYQALPEEEKSNWRRK